MFTCSRPGLMGALLVAGLLASAADAIGQSAREVAQRSLPSVVLLVMEDSAGQPFSMGSAFFVRPDVVATNVHVVEGAVTGYARPVGIASKMEIVGVVGLDRQHDLTLLKLRDANAAPLRLTDDSGAAIGDPVYAVGNPEGLQGTFSEGIVSGVRETESGRLLQITAPISPGSSGGPILNAFGEVVGVAVATYREGQNLNFAVPSGYLLKMLGAIGPVVELTTVRRELAAKSVTSGTGDRPVDGVVALDFQWTVKYSFSTDYTFTLRNRLRRKVFDINCLLIFYGKNGEPRHSMEIRYREPILAGLAKTVIGAYPSNAEGHVETPPGQIRDLTKRVEVRVLDFRVMGD